MTLTKSSQSPTGKQEELAPLILLPLDGSRIAEQALPVVGTLAHRGGTKVHLASVIPPMPVFLEAVLKPSRLSVGVHWATQVAGESGLTASVFCGVGGAYAGFWRVPSYGFT